MSYIELFAAPQVGHQRSTETGLEVLVSARLLQEAIPYDEIVHVDPSKPEVLDGMTGTLLVEARDLENIDLGTISYAVFEMRLSDLILLDAQNVYGYDQDGLTDCLIDLAEGLSYRIVGRSCDQSVA